MPASFSSFIFSALLALVLLVLPGFALLRICVAARALGFISRLTLAPGVTIALSVVMFAWCKVFGLKLGPATPWLMIAAAVLSLLVDRQRGRWRLANGISPHRLRRIPIADWLAGCALVAILAVLLVVRFNSTREWLVPPGIDSPHHTVIVQLLLEHHGLFDSWAPYSDAETFTYHFGFHAVAALVAWMSGSDAVFATFVMARVMGVCAVAALFGLVRLWTRSSWAGVFAAAFWELYSQHLYFFDPWGRWTPLAGLAVLPSALVLLSLFLRAGRRPNEWRLGLLCVTTSAGLVLAQYKTAVIFAVLATVLFSSRCVAAMLETHSQRRGRIIGISCRALAIVVVMSLLVTPRLTAVMETKTGQQLNRILFQAPPPKSTGVGAPTKNARELFLSGFTNLQQATTSSLALLAGVAILLRRRKALWFVVGWAAVIVVMNPTLVGIYRAGLIDEIFWSYASPTAIAVMAGLAVGLACETVNFSRNFAWNGALFVSALLLSGWGAFRLPPAPEFARFVLPEDLGAMKWIKANVPENEKIAGRAYFHDWIVLEQDAIMWVPYFTRHLSNHMLLAAALEKAPTANREKSRSFTVELYRRDMSTPESAAWMREQGYRWFYSGANMPAVHAAALDRAKNDRQLLDQLARNPAFESVFAQGAARLYRVR
jgi:hypothetical protein